MTEMTTAVQPAPSYSTLFEKAETVGGAMLSGLMFGGVKAAAINGSVAFVKSLADEAVYKVAPEVASSGYYRFISGAGDVLITSSGPLKTKGTPQAFGAAVSEIAAKLANHNVLDEEPSEPKGTQTSLWDVALSVTTRMGTAILWQQQAQALVPKPVVNAVQPTVTQGTKMGGIAAKTLLVTIAGDVAQKGDPFRTSQNIYF
ncbi:hypothetical protein [Parashewanella tropica]|uniref:hypothetical protein n=1 Tax=Parashewanella tropica TaxID=2547970 RepID=UPI00105983DC|nr:hypothetical protein [Parashewanella tropica]